MMNRASSIATDNATVRSRFAARLQQFVERVLKPTRSPVGVLPPSPSRVPRALLESLESRLCPSVTVAIGNIGGHAGETLNISGPDSGQHVVITEDAAHNRTTVQVDANGDGVYTGPGDYSRTFGELFGRINVKLQSGSGNTVDYLLASDMTGADRDFRIKLGRGTNFFNFDTQGHSISDNTLLTFAVSSKNNSASEKVSFNFDTIDNSEVDFGIKLGSGTHNVNAVFNGPIQNNSLVQGDLKFGYGLESTIVDLRGNISNSSVHINTTGGDDVRGHDSVTYLVGGVVSNGSLLDLGMALRNGADTGQVIVSQSGFASLDTSEVYFTIDGGEGNDTITYGSDHTAGTIAVDGLVDALLYGANGDDKINVDFPQTAALDLTGTFRVEAHGDSGNDTFRATLSNTATSDGSYDVLLLGGSGNDAFTLINNDPTGTGALYDYFGFDLVDGGSGFDVATLTGVGIDTRHIDR